MNAIILASGKGTRMQPWTNNKNKVMFKVDGKPLLQHHIENLLRIGVKQIFITTWWKSEEIEFQFKHFQEVIFFKEGSLNGSGTAVNQIMLLYSLKKTIIIYGDTYYDTYYYQLIKLLYKKKKNFIIVDNWNCNDKNGLIKYTSDDFKILEIKENGFSDQILPEISIGKNIGLLIINLSLLYVSKLSTGDLMNSVLKTYLNSEGIKNLYVFPIFSTKKNVWCDIGQINIFIQFILDRYDNETINSLIKYPRERTTFIQFAKKILLAKRIFLAGNGGSLSTAQHLALDWSKVGGKNAIALGEASVLTAYGNDEGYDNVFLKQLKCFSIDENDVIVLISGSGNSPNICKVIQKYPDNVIGMTGQTGYLLCNCKLTLPVPSENIRVIEDAHLAYGHAITEIMDGLN
ncbi:MAG: sugar phosphate nucleotidyltransferase [Candidatus Nanoarchaeia archaeon]|nr:sugar phosphate nucleotidyltransferase [Candidatus Nanoarchaeia archaeon]